jgi:hypothetical protein
LDGSFEVGGFVFVGVEGDVVYERELGDGEFILPLH